jgi:RNA polymerase sigma factor (sigma-70 family)
MAQARLDTVARQLRSLVEARSLTEAADGELLERFRARHDEAAFAALLRRHGPMVLGVGRRILRHEQDAEDIFQAAFLLLARQAHAIRLRESVGNWLHGVARRLAIRLKTQSVQRQKRESQAAAMRDTSAAGEAAWRELQAILDEELAHLPAHYRNAVILCCLEGKTQEEAARQLGCPLGTVRSRLARGRELLHKRVTARGLLLSAAALATALTASGPTAAPSALLHATQTAAFLLAGENAARAVVPPTIAALMEAGLRTAAGAKAKLALAALVVAAAIVGVALGIGSQLEEQAAHSSQETSRNSQGPKSDAYGDLLPPDAVMRLGSLRWRHEGEAAHLAFSANGKLLAATNRDGTIRLFDTATGKLLYRVRPEVEDRPSGFGPLAFSPDGNYLAFQAGYGTVPLWDLKKKQYAHTLSAKVEEQGDGAPFWRISFSPDGKLLAACAGSNCIAVWEVGSGRQVASVRGHNHGNPPIVFSPDGKMIAVSSKPIVQLFDASTGKRIRSFNPDQKWALDLAFSPDGKSIASGAEGLIVLSDVESGKETGRLRLPAYRIGGVLRLAFTPDSKSLVSGDEDARVIVWDLATRKERFVLDSHGWIGRSMALSLDGKTVAMGTAHNVIRLWDVATGKERFTEPLGHDAPVHAVAFSPDGKQVLTGGENRHIHLWDATTGRHRRRFLGQSAKAVSFSPDGKRLAACWINDANARVWDVATGDEVLKLGHETSLGVHGIAFAANGKLLLSLDRIRKSNSARLTVWEAATGKRLREVPLPIRPECLAVSWDGKLAAVLTHADLPVRLYDVEHGKELAPFPFKQSAILSLAFSTDGRILATGGSDKTICLWQTVSRSLIATYQGDDRAVTAVAFSLDGRFLASADGGGPLSNPAKPTPAQKIHLWDVASARPLAHLDGHDSDVASLAFAPDGKRLVSGLSNGTVLVWDIAEYALKARPAPLELSSEKIAALWIDLASDDASKGFAAVWKLASCPSVVPYLRTRVQPTEGASRDQLTRWIADLDSPVFGERAKASRELEGQGELAEPLLRKTLAADPSPEVRRRIEALLDKLQGPVTFTETLRSIRAVEVLEHIATPEAQQLLQKLADGAPAARLTRDAKAALERLSSR